jgi:glycosyltransferase involved in cell wall biosynthesis
MNNKELNNPKDKPKRVLMIAQSTYDYDARIIRYCKALIEVGIEADVICFKYFNQKTFEKVNGVNVYRITNFNNKDSIIRYILFSVKFLIKAFLKTILLHKKYNYDLIHVHNMPDYLVFAALYPKLKKVPVFLDIHDLTVELFKEKWSVKKFNLFKPLLIFTEKFSCSFADHIITVTKECVDILINRGINREKISLIMNAPDDNLFSYNDLRFRKNGSDKTFRILYHGTLAKRFGLHNVVDAIKIVQEKFPYIEFHIFGNKNSDYAKELLQRAYELNISNNIFINQSVPHDQVNNIIKRYDLGIVTYEPTEYMNLAFPTKAGEYALTGLPMIMTELQAVKSIFRSDSIVFLESPNSKLIADHILELIDNKEKRYALSLNALADVKRISWSKMKEVYMQLIYKV